MAKRLGEYLEEIGHEVHDTIFMDASGEVRSITKDEQLAREVWKRALGSESECKNADGNVSHRIFPPDPKAQSFIFERREGKIVVPEVPDKTPLLDHISEIIVGEVNEMVEDE